MVFFQPQQFIVTFRASRPEIDVTPETIHFGTIGPGGEAAREIYLNPNEAAAAVGTTISLANEASLPKGASIEINTPQVAVKGKTTVHVKLRLAADAVATGELKGAILLKVADQAVALAAIA